MRMEQKKSGHTSGGTHGGKQFRLHYRYGVLWGKRYGMELAILDMRSGLFDTEGVVLV